MSEKLAAAPYYSFIPPILFLARRRLHEVRRLLDALAEVVVAEEIPSWLHQRNSAFENMTPLQVIEVGEVDRLWQMVYSLGSGNLD